MICPNCNREIPDGSNICGYCSADLRNMGGNQQYRGRPQPSVGVPVSGGRFKLTKKGLIVIGGALVLVVLLIILIVSILGGGKQDDPTTGQLVPQVQHTPQNYPMFGATEAPPEILTPTEDPLLSLPLAVDPTPTVAPTEMPVFETLRNGDSGPEVEQLQTRLKYYGYLEGTVDGQYGPATADAVKKFQEYAGLAVDGRAGNETLRMLYSLPFDEMEAMTNLDSAPGANRPVLTAKPDTPG